MTWQGNGSSVVGVDLGGTKILSGVVDADNRILGRAKRSTPAKDGGPAILKAIVDCVDEAVADAGLSRGDINVVGLGSPGPLDVNAGAIIFSANLNVKNYPSSQRRSNGPSWCATTFAWAATPNFGWVPGVDFARSSRHSSGPGSAAV
jgi:predicted NBD/HSP70 family sugar kinase